MGLPAVLKSVEACAPGRRITVIAFGKSYELPSKPAPVEVDPPHPFEDVSKQMLERDAEIRALLTAVAERSDGALNQVKEVVTEGQNKLAHSLEQLAVMIGLPTEPVYNAAGKLIGAQKVKKLGEHNGERAIRPG